MPFKIVRSNIIDMNVDVIVNSTSENYDYVGGAEQEILDKGGNDLYTDRVNLGSIYVSESRYTKGYRLLSDYVIHTVGPTWLNEGNEPVLLRKTYRNVLSMAKALNCDSIAFPLISTGTFGFPKKEALEIAQDVIKEFLEDNEMMIYLVVYDQESFILSQELFNEVEEYLEDNFESEEEIMQLNRMQYKSFSEKSLLNRLSDIDEGFSKTLLKLIEDIGEKPSTIYKRANVAKQLYSKIKLNPDYHPSKQIAIAFSIGLKLNLDETNDFIERAGYVLSNSIKFDVIIEYCVDNEVYDVYEVNYILFDNDQNLLGSTMD